MNTKKILHELKHHAPFTAFAALIAMAVAILIQYVLKYSFPDYVFDMFHFGHIIVSATVTSAIFYKYRNKFILAVLIGITGALIIGSLSDVIFPYLGSLIFDAHTHFHLPIINETVFTLSSALFGAVIGASIGITRFPHFAHVFLSVFASLFYIFTYSSVFSLAYFALVFLIIFVAVIIPCCLSDIIFPLLFIRKSK